MYRFMQNAGAFAAKLVDDKLVNAITTAIATYDFIGSPLFTGI